MLASFLRSIPNLVALAAGALLVAAGCGGLGLSSASSFSAGGDSLPGVGEPYEDAGGPPTYLTEAGASADAGNPTNLKGNPLCVTPTIGACSPQLDNSGQQKEAGTADDQCHTLLDQDGGETYACHVTKQANGTVAPTCTPAGSSTAECSTQATCKAGYECVGAQIGTCRRYCCDPTACDPSSFCDVQSIVALDVRVPVCTPIQSCDLFGACRDASQQCGIVDQTKGTTSCLDIGPRTEGEECETDHCAKDLVCLGNLGSRKCFQLCDTKNASSCAIGMRCLTNSVTFKSADVGICGQ
jgi:hypothetical protein